MRTLHDLIEPEPPLSPKEKFKVALDLMEAGLDMKRQQFRRAYPSEGPEQIEARVVAWWQDQPPPGLHAGTRLRSLEDL